MVLPEPPNEERLAFKIAANSPPFIPSLSQDAEKRSRLRAADERISNRVAELKQRARRELNPRPSDSKCILEPSTGLFNPSQGLTIGNEG